MRASHPSPFTLSPSGSAFWPLGLRLPVLSLRTMSARVSAAYETWDMGRAGMLQVSA